MHSITRVKFRTLKPGFGAEVLDVDLASADPELIDEVVRVFDLHGVLLVRDQHMEPDDLMRFLGHFGVLEDHTLKQYTLPNYPKIYVLSNRKDRDGRPIGAHNDGIGRPSRSLRYDST